AAPQSPSQPPPAEVPWFAAANPAPVPVNPSPPPAPSPRPTRRAVREDAGHARDNRLWLPAGAGPGGRVGVGLCVVVAIVTNQPDAPTEHPVAVDPPHKSSDSHDQQSKLAGTQHDNAKKKEETREKPEPIDPPEEKEKPKKPAEPSWKQSDKIRQA